MKEKDPNALVSALEWRYAAKSFDPTQKIPLEIWSALERSLVLTPSSYGLQPWKFIVVEDLPLREKLRLASWNQRQVVECSHYVVIAQKTAVDEAYVDKFVQLIVSTRGVDPNTLAGLKRVIMGDVVTGERSRYVREWAARQCYIALGNLLTSAALLGVDTCPMEGFDPAKYDEILGLEPKGLTAAVACAVGYRNPEDRFGTFKKVRFPHEELVDRR